MMTSISSACPPPQALSTGHTAAGSKGFPTSNLLHEYSVTQQGRPRIVKHDHIWFNSDDNGWVCALAVLDDAEQSLLLFPHECDPEIVANLDDPEAMHSALLVAGLHEASTEIVNPDDAPANDVLRLDLRGMHCSDSTHSNRVLMAFGSADQMLGWTAAIKRASFPCGPLWTSRPQNIEEYAMSRFQCPKVGAVWKAEGTKTSVIIDSLRLCNTNSLADLPSSESFLLLLRLKIFGCILSLDKVISSRCDASVAEVEVLKTKTLQELLNFVTSCEMTGVQIDEIAFLDLIEMICINVMRPLQVMTSNGHEKTFSSSYSSRGGSVHNSSTRDESAWTHLALCYELLLKLLSSNVCDISVKKRCVREEMCHEFVQLFRSCNQMERDYVKTIAHCMYSKLVSYRGTMRQAMANSLLDYVHVSHVHEGVGEMLEVFGSIASGFAVPVKEEHKSMLLRTLLPLYSMQGSENYHEQLSFVHSQYVAKDQNLVVSVVEALLKYWPHRNAAKQILFLGEIGELVGLMEFHHFVQVRRSLLAQLNACISGRHFQVAEYAMGLLNNNALYAHVFDDVTTRRHAYPALVRSLRAASMSWNASVRQIGADILQFMRTLDTELFVEAEMKRSRQELSSGMNQSSNYSNFGSGKTVSYLKNQTISRDHDSDSNSDGHYSNNRESKIERTHRGRQGRPPQVHLRRVQSNQDDEEEENARHVLRPDEEESCLFGCSDDAVIRVSNDDSQREPSQHSHNLTIGTSSPEMSVTSPDPCSASSDDTFRGDIDDALVDDDDDQDDEDVDCGFIGLHRNTMLLNSDIDDEDNTPRYEENHDLGTDELLIEDGDDLERNEATLHDLVTKGADSPLVSSGTPKAALQSSTSSKIAPHINRSSTPTIIPLWNEDTNYSNMSENPTI